MRRAYWGCRWQMDIWLCWNHYWSQWKGSHGIYRAAGEDDAGQAAPGGVPERLEHSDATGLAPWTVHPFFL